MQSRTVLMCLVHMPFANYRVNVFLFPQVAKLVKAKEKYKEFTGHDFAPNPQQKKAKSTSKAQVCVRPAKPAQRSMVQIFAVTVQYGGGSATAPNRSFLRQAFHLPSLGHEQVRFFTNTSNDC